MMNSRVVSILVILLVTLIVVSASTFVVKEQDLALRVRLSAIVESDYAPGLHFKVPFLENVVKFDRRVLTRRYDGEQFLTKESQSLSVDYYIKWRISDASQFYQATAGDESIGETLLGENVQDGIKGAVARRTLKDIVTADRQAVTGEFMERANTTAQKLGIELIDVRVQRIDLQEEVAQSVYDSMKRGFEAIARSERGEGDRQAQIVRAEAEREKTELIARAQADSARLRGEGEAAATAIHAGAYSRNAEFYAFWRSLQAYRSSIGNDRDVLVISPDSEFFRYLKTPTPPRR
jgi:membrane protease subunit HflC